MIVFNSTTYYIYKFALIVEMRFNKIIIITIIEYMPMKTLLFILLIANIAYLSSGNSNLTIGLTKKTTKKLSKYRDNLLGNLTDTVFKDALGNIHTLPSQISVNL